VLFLLLAQDLEQIALELGVAQIAELDRHQVAVHAQHRRHAHREVHVRTALLGAEFQEGVDACQRRAPGEYAAV
jgi:hypothetical protein